MFFCENLCVSSYKDKRNKVVSVSIGHNEWTASTRAARPVRRVDLFRLFLAVLLSHNYFHPLILSLLEGMTFSLTSYTMTISLINNTVFSGCCFIQETELKSSA